MVSAGAKRCRKCGEIKSLDGFPISRRNRDGRNTQCKECMAAYSREHYRRKHPVRQRRSCLKPFSQAQWAEVIARGVLRCRSCGREKPLSEFWKHCVRGRKYYHRACKTCARKESDRERQKANHKRRRCGKYGLTPEQFDRLLESQGHRCAVCGRPFMDQPKAIDHDHGTKQIRGIVHSQCNLVLGYAHDDPVVLAGALEYLLRFLRRKKKRTPQEALLARVKRWEIVA